MHTQIVRYQPVELLCVRINCLVVFKKYFSIFYILHINCNAPLKE